MITYQGIKNNKRIPVLMVGFNRRFFSIKKLRKFRLDNPKSFIYSCIGLIDSSNWIHDPKIGGRLIGEVCHFVDLLRFLADSN